MNMYRSSQSIASIRRNLHNMLSIQIIEEQTNLLEDFIYQNNITDQNVVQYLSKITEMVEAGAQIAALVQNNNNVLSLITNYYMNIIQNYYTTNNNQATSPLFQTINPYLQLLYKMSSSNDNECATCARKSEYHIFLQETLRHSKEVPILSEVIKIIINLVSNKPLTASLFDTKILINKLYIQIYNNFFLLNKRPDEFLIYSKDQKQEVINSVVTPSFELVLTLLVSNKSENEYLKEYIYRLVFTFGCILSGERSEQNDQTYQNQLILMLSQLEFILASNNKEIIESFTTMNIIMPVLKSVQNGGEISKKALKCLECYANNFTAAFIIIKEPIFNTFCPTNDSRIITSYCAVWIKIIQTLVKGETSITGRIQYAQQMFQQLAPKILRYLQFIYGNEENDFECKKVIMHAIISFASVKLDNIMNEVISLFPNIFELVQLYVEDQNPDDIACVMNILLNIMNVINRSGNKYDQVKESLKVVGEDIKKDISETINGMDEMNNNYIELFKELENHLRIN